MTDAELKYMTHVLETARRVSQARNAEMHRVVDLLVSRAQDAEPVVAMALLETAREVLGEKR